MKKMVWLLVAVLLLGICGNALAASTVVDREVMETKNWDDQDILMKVRWSGVNFYEFVLPNGKTIVMDPYYDPDTSGTGHNEFNYTPTDLPAGEWVNGADYILLTHTHGDHCAQLKEVLEVYPDAFIVVPENAFPELVLRYGIGGSLRWVTIGAIDKLSFVGCTVDCVRSNHNLSRGTQLKDLDSSKYEETGAKGDYYTNQFSNQIANYKITTDEGFTVLLWNSEMYDQYGYEARMWFYEGAEPDLFMYQVAGASFNYDRRNPECGPMGRFVASVRPKAALPEHQQHFAYSELDAIATQFCGYCDEQGVSCEFLTPETGVWYGYTKDADGTVHAYRLLDPAPN